MMYWSTSCAPCGKKILTPAFYTFSSALSHFFVRWCWHLCDRNCWNVSRPGYTITPNLYNRVQFNVSYRRPIHCNVINASAQHSMSFDTATLLCIVTVIWAVPCVTCYDVPVGGAVVYGWLRDRCRPTQALRGAVGLHCCRLVLGTRRIWIQQ